MTEPTTGQMLGGDVHVVAETRSLCGEGPVWESDNNRLLWVDILGCSVHTTSFDALTPTTSLLTCPTWIGAVAPRHSGGLVAATRDGFATIHDDGTYEDRLPFLSDSTRMNDAACDAAGRFWAGVTDEDFREGEGALCVLEPDWTVRTVLEGLTLPNGLGWSPDGHTLYLVDTMERVVWAYDFDVAEGALTDRRAIVRYPAEDPGLPDGLCIDRDGFLWIAMWSGSRIDRHEPDGTPAGSVTLPVERPTSCGFGDPDLTTLYVTSARDGLDVEEAALDGALLAVRGLGVVGLPGNTFAG